MRTHVPTAAQKKAFDKVVKAFQMAKKSGLVFYAKSQNIVAYTKEADNYIENEHGFENCLRGEGYQIPYISKSFLINDSGADDYASYITKDDELKFNP